MTFDILFGVRGETIGGGIFQCLKTMVLVTTLIRNGVERNNILFCLFLSQTIDISILSIHSCIQDVNSGLGKVLTYISSVKGLAAIRDEVWQLLHDDNKMTTWDVVCDAVLDKKLLIWDSLFRELFLTRTKVLS